MIDENPAVVDSCNDAQTESALQFVARRGQLEILKLLLDRGAYPCHRLGEKGLTALEFASQEMMRPEVARIIANYYGKIIIAGYSYVAVSQLFCRTSTSIFQRTART